MTRRRTKRNNRRRVFRLILTCLSLFLAIFLLGKKLGFFTPHVRPITQDAKQWLDQYAHSPAAELSVAQRQQALSAEVSIYQYGPEDLAVADGQVVVQNILAVLLSPGYGEEHAHTLASQLNAEVVSKNTIIDLYELRFQNCSLQDLSAIKDQLSAMEGVEAAYQQTILQNPLGQTTHETKTPNDPWEHNAKGPDGWNEARPSGTNWGLEAIKAPSAWQLFQQRKQADITIGIIDGYTGLQHPDLGNITLGIEKDKKIMPDKGLPTDMEKNQLAKWKHLADHGSHVAGIIGADFNNGIGISGVYPDASMVLICNFPQTYDTVMNGITALVSKHHARVINISLGDDVNQTINEENEIVDPLIKDTAAQQEAASLRDKTMHFLGRLVNKGYDFLIVQAAGNARRIYTDILGFKLEKLEAYDCVHNGLFSAITREETEEWLTGKTEYAGLDAKDLRNRILVVGNAEMNGYGGYRYHTSSCGGPNTDLAAPGVDILSCSYEDGYYLSNGTSMAAPYAAGVAGMVWAINPRLTGPEVHKILIDSARVIVSSSNRKPTYQLLPVDHQFDQDTWLLDAHAATQAAVDSLPASQPRDKDDFTGHWDWRLLQVSQREKKRLHDAFALQTGKTPVLEAFFRAADQGQGIATGVFYCADAQGWVEYTLLDAKGFGQAVQTNIISKYCPVTKRLRRLADVQPFVADDGVLLLHGFVWEDSRADSSGYSQRSASIEGIENLGNMHYSYGSGLFEIETQAASPGNAATGLHRLVFMAVHNRRLYTLKGKPLTKEGLQAWTNGAQILKDVANCGATLEHLLHYPNDVVEVVFSLPHGQEKMYYIVYIGIREGTLYYLDVPLLIHTAWNNAGALPTTVWTTADTLQQAMFPTMANPLLRPDAMDSPENDQFKKIVFCKGIDELLKTIQPMETLD